MSAPFSPPPTPPFLPTRQAALSRLAEVRPAAYASSRNHLQGSVTRLSPYLTHGLMSVPEVALSVAARQKVHLQHKLVQELGWREFFHHVWRHQGEAIFTSLHAGPRPDADYLAELPDDIRQARTGVPVIDAAVRTLYATGWLHNHARMWLASYVVHVRGVYWRAGADWLVAHLLDGDLASNHLSWQWIAGTGSHKPYLFNAENVARYAGTVPGWASPGSVVDTDYATLEAWARGTAPLPPVPAASGKGVDEPTLHHSLPAGPNSGDNSGLPAPLPMPQPMPNAKAVAKREVWLVHPWALADAPHAASPDALRLGVWPAEFHTRWPWSAATGSLWPPAWPPSAARQCGPIARNCSRRWPVPRRCAAPTTCICRPAGPPPGASPHHACCPSRPRPAARSRSSGARPRRAQSV